MLELNFAPFPIIKTERLLLRQINNEDVNEVFVLRSDERVLRYIDKAPAQTLEDALEFIRRITELEKGTEAVTWGIALKDEPH